MRITCHYCGREDVEEVAKSWKGFVIETSPDVFIYINPTKPICVDCTDVTAHFVKKGLRAFRESLSSRQQMDLFPADRLINER